MWIGLPLNINFQSNLGCFCNPQGSDGCCHPTSGQCECYHGIVGKTCNECPEGYHGFPSCTSNTIP